MENATNITNENGASGILEKIKSLKWLWYGFFFAISGAVTTGIRFGKFEDKMDTSISQSDSVMAKMVHLEAEFKRMDTSQQNFRYDFVIWRGGVDGEISTLKTRMDYFEKYHR